MASSRTPLLADDRRQSIDSAYDNEETAILGGFATAFHPTIYTRSIALVLAFPAFVIFIVQGPHYSPAIVFLSFAIARQLVVLGSHLGSQIVVIHIEVMHHRLKGVSAKAQETWIKRTVAATIDGVVLLGLLVTLSLVAHEVDTHALPAVVTHAVTLGFIAFGLLLPSTLDFADPTLVSLALAVEKPVAGVLRLATSLTYGSPDEAQAEETQEYRSVGRSIERVHSQDIV